jgi:hypothetical protein
LLTENGPFKTTFINDLGQMECERVTKLENGESGLRVDGGACQRENNLNLRANDDTLTVRVESREMS